MAQPIYLDYAAATPLSPAVKAAMEPYWQTDFYNPSATYEPARKVRTALERARQDVAEALGARAADIVFTAGGTEANNLAIHGVMQRHPGKQVVTTTVEHESILEPARAYNVRLTPVAANGIVDVNELERLIDDDTVLVSVMYANNELGTVQPIREIAARIASIRKQRRAAGNATPLYLHTDAAQAAQYLDVHVAPLGIDLMTINGGKLYGPKQSGVLYVRGGLVLEPVLRGGGQEHGVRSGTENVAACIGFAAALQETQTCRHEETRRLSALQKQFFHGVKDRLPSVRVNGSTSRRLPNNLHLTFPGLDNERLLLQLEQAGILAAAGSACSASSEQPSHVLAALGLTEAEARSSLRFTMGRGTSEDDVRTLLDVLERLVA